MGRSGTSSNRASRRRYDRVPVPARASLVAALDEHYQDWATLLDDEEREALRSYTHIHYTLVNAHLRGWDCDALNDIRVLARTAELVTSLDQALKRTQLPFPLLVHRGAKDARFADPTRLVGGIIEDAGFMSVSLDRNTARKFARRYHEFDYHQELPAALLEITLPEGSPAAYLGADRFLTADLDEHELLLPRGMTLQVDAVRGGQLPVIVCRLAGRDG